MRLFIAEKPSVAKAIAGELGTAALDAFITKQEAFIRDTCKQTYPDLKGRPNSGKGRNGPAE